MKNLRFAFLFLILLFSSCLYAQYFNDGQDRGAIKWHQIRTDNFNVIYPEDFDNKAIRVASLLEKAYISVPKSLNHKPKKVTVVLHTETVKSNAFMGWCPSRIEMYVTPHQNIYSQDWLEQLSIHEFRHVVQVSKLEEEMPRVLKYIFGEHAAALLAGFYLPFWFIEGDAVAVETGLSNSGRGRYPDFIRELRAQLIEKGKYSFDKAYLGSSRDFVPDHYQMGHWLVAGAREKYNKLVWDSVLTYVAGHPFGVVSFDSGLKKSIGINSSQLYDSIFTDLTQRWRIEDSLLVSNKGEKVSPSNRYYTNYTFSSRLPDGRYFAKKSGLADISRFVAIEKDGHEKRLFTPGFNFEESVNSAGNMLVWSERIPDVRWHHADNSLLRVFDVESGKLSEFRYNSTIFSPALSPNLDKIIVAEADNKYQSYLVEIDTQSGKILRKYTSPSHDYFITPSYLGSSDTVLTVAIRNNQKGILAVDLKNQSEKIVLPFGNQEIKRPIFHQNYLFFIGGNRGVNDLYALDYSSNECYRVITSRFGLADYSLHADTIIYSDYTADGFCIRQMKITPNEFHLVNLDSLSYKAPFAQTLNQQEGGAIDFLYLDTINYKSIKYKKTSHLFKFHSWAPLAVDPYNYMIYPGVSVASQNMLSTSEFIAGYRYRWESKNNEFYLNYKYLGWFPVISVEGNYGKKKLNYGITGEPSQTNHKGEEIKPLIDAFEWDEASVRTQVYLPLNFSKGAINSFLYPSINHMFTYCKTNETTPFRFPSGSINSMEYSLRFYSMLKQSQQAIFPRFGALFDVGFFHYLSSTSGLGRYAYVSGLSYFPGFFKNHSIRVAGGYQAKYQNEFLLTNKINFPRGHLQSVNSKMLSYSVDYKLPVAFPDWGLSRFLYLRRIELGFFYDQAFLRSRYVKNHVFNLRSTGGEIVFKSNVFRFFAPIDFGFRCSYLFNNKFDTDFLFNITFSL